MLSTLFVCVIRLQKKNFARVSEMKKRIWRIGVGAARSWAHQWGRDCAMSGILDMLDKLCDSPLRTLEPDRPVGFRKDLHGSTPQQYVTCGAIRVGEAGKWPIYYIHFFPETLRRSLDWPDGITKKFALFCRTMTHCVALAREDMPNKSVILNNLCESLQWLSEHTDTSGMSWS